MSRAFVDDDRDESGRPRRHFDLPPREDPSFDAAAARALLEAARDGQTGDAEAETGYYWGEPALREHVAKILREAEREGDERLEQVARRYLK